MREEACKSGLRIALPYLDILSIFPRKPLIIPVLLPHNSDHGIVLLGIPVNVLILLKMRIAQHLELSLRKISLMDYVIHGVVLFNDNIASTPRLHLLHILF